MCVYVCLCFCLSMCMCVFVRVLTADGCARHNEIYEKGFEIRNRQTIFFLNPSQKNMQKNDVLINIYNNIYTYQIIHTKLPN